MSEVGEKEYDFDDEAKQKIMNYNVESDESDTEDHGKGQELTSYDPYVESSSSSLNGDDNWHFSCEERKRCGRIVHSVVKELFKNGSFFEKLYCEKGYGGKGNSGVVKLKSFSDEIRDFLEKDHEESFKLVSSGKNGKDNSFITKLKKCVKILCNADC